MIFFKRWSIEEIRKRLFELPGISDVFTEQPFENRFLVHVFVDADHSDLREGIKQAVGRIPRGTKVDVLLLYQN